MKIIQLFIKSVFLACGLLILNVNVEAQTEKGKFLVGGESSMNFIGSTTKWKTSYGSGENGKTRSLDAKAQFGYFLFKNFVAGLEIPVSYYKDISDNSYSIYSTVTFVPFLKYYFGNSNIKPFIQAGIGPGWGRQKFHASSGTESKIPTRMLAYEIDGGVGIFLNEHFAVEMEIGYAYASSKWHEKTTNTDWQSTNSGTGLSIGLTFCL